MTRTVKETYLYKIHRIYEMMVRSIREDLASAGVTHENYMTLRFIYENPGLTQTELAEVNGKDRNVIGRTIDKLEELHHVERRKDKNDRRIYRIYSTEEGNRFVEEYWPRVLNIQEECLNTLSVEEKTVLMELIEKTL